MAALYSLRHGHARSAIIAADNLLVRHVPLDFFSDKALRLVRGEDMGLEPLLEQLLAWGYERVPMVGNHGEFSRRGDIFDIYPPGYEKPVRLEFFGDTIDEIRLFDAGTQRSIADLPETLILPVHPLCRETDRAKAGARWRRLFQKGLLSEAGLRHLNHALEHNSAALLPGALYDASTTLEEWLPRGAVWVLPGRRDMEDALEAAGGHWHESLADEGFDPAVAAGARNAVPPQPAALALRPADQARVWEAGPAAVFESVVLGRASGDADLPERPVQEFTDLFVQPDARDRPWQTLVRGLKNWRKSRRQVLLAFTGERSRNRFLKLAEQDGLIPFLRYSPEEKGLFALIAPVRGGADLVWDDTLFLSEDVLQPHQPGHARTLSGAFRGLDRHDDLEPGNILVHRDYGIARFAGLVRLPGDEADNDFLLLEYAGDDKLYLPVDRLSLVQRFKADAGIEPVLDQLGGPSWQSGKERARRAIERIARDLVEMYAWRKVAKGIHYDPPGEMYREFEASFGFEETPDQARAIQDVLADMEKPEPMDRLVCGDVGFGKTEVALRAAFRAACEGRQVALLCPTTVLAEQHYQTFRSRLANFAVNVGLLSRFVSAAAQKEVLKAAASGQIDILIGTHRILSDDVKLPNLALLILDEEQRFGVRHKEKLKALRRNVDALTLTATPIPRTLQLSMSGIRELSVIETAPPERKPVSTALIARDRAVLGAVLAQELKRGGQVFWVYNRVQGLEQVAAFVRELAPQARVGMAHGRMAEKALEESMRRFWHHELDILVCTSIIESGLDFANANTLIVDQAHMFGLGQLYQLRGRVGRSDRQAYAVFVVSDERMLSDKARERLRVILNLDYLGAGFQAAMEDLRLRGAGNILGEAQSGHMARVGLDLFLEMLEQAVSRLKNGRESLYTETELNIGVAAHIPESYIPDGRERLRWYKMLSAATDASVLRERELELRDRFGLPPEPVRIFFAVLSLKQQLTKLKAARADIRTQRIRIAWETGQVVSGAALVAFVQEHAGRARLLPPATMELQLDSHPDLAQRLQEAQCLLHGLDACPQPCAE
jgi:transcription-repair coupling factor (superfamily II helicase)